VPSGIIVISVITVGSAVQIKRSRLSSVATLITCRGYPDTRQVGVRLTVNTSQYVNCKKNETEYFIFKNISVRRTFNISGEILKNISVK
jgi:hypothetical protein